MKKLIALIAATLACSLSIACGGSEEAKPDPGPKYPTKDSFCTGLAGAVCQQALIDNCGTVAKADCEKGAPAKCTSLDVFFGIGGGAYHSDKAEACLAEVTATYADGKITSDEFKKVGAVCGAMLSPLRPAGSDCTTDLECAANLHCTFSLADGKGVCSDGKQTGGDSCASMGCQAGLFCNASKSCAKGRELTEACDVAKDPCKPELLCSEKSKTCTARLGAGTSCKANTECDSGFCGALPTEKDPNVRVCLTALNYGAGSPACNQFNP